MTSPIYNRVSPCDLVLGEKYYITNLGLDCNYCVQLNHHDIFTGIVSEYYPDAGKVLKDETIFPSIGLSKLTNTSHSESMLSYYYIKGWNIHHEDNYPIFFK